MATAVVAARPATVVIAALVITTMVIASIVFAMDAGRQQNAIGLGSAADLYAHAHRQIGEAMETAVKLGVRVRDDGPHHPASERDHEGGGAAVESSDRAAKFQPNESGTESPQGVATSAS
jgi:hypothetical protein